MNEFERISFLTDFLNKTSAEYEEGHPSISDEEWDTLYFELKALEEKTGITMVDSPTQVINYQVVTALDKVEHNHKMLSLDKTKELTEVKAFLGNHEFISMCKMDGLTCSLHYVNGNLVSAETRGNGLVGENILHNAKVISSIPNKIKYRNELIVDGEIICSWSDFDTFSSEYKNPRNFAAGSIRLLDSKECSKRKLQFVAWDVISGLEDIPTLRSRLMKLNEFGFTVVPFEDETVPVDVAVDKVKELADKNGYPIDGVVFKFNDVEYGKTLGETSHHFRNAIAYKFYDELYPTMLLGVEWTMGRTGVLTPVALLDPIDIDGSTVERASLHNLSIMKELFPAEMRTGYTAYVYKANMIIPQIDHLEHEVNTCAKRILIPKVCPVCGGETSIEVSDSGVENLVCTNPQCEGKLINRLDHFCGKKGLDIKGLSKATLEKLIDWEWVNNIVDIYSLSEHRDAWIQKPGFGAKSVSNILTAIENSKNCEMSSFISALGIPLIGSTYAKALSKNQVDWHSVRRNIANHYDFTHYDGFGPEMCTSLWRFDYTEADKLAEILNISNSLWISPEAKEEAKTAVAPLKDVTVVITGKLVLFKNRAELQSQIEAAGGKVVGSVSKNTNYLINNDSTSTSSKNLSAQKLGVPILTEADFVEKFLKNS